MVNIPKIVIRSQTRLTLNERFSQFSEQQKARMATQKNDMQTRITEESFANGLKPEELSEKLERMTKDLDNPDRHKPSPSDEHPRNRARNNRHRSEAHEEAIVPTYRELLYDDRSRRQRRRRNLTYGDILNGPAPSFDDDGGSSHWKAETLRSSQRGEDAFVYSSGKYANPLMRDSDEEEDDSKMERSKPSIHSRLGLRINQNKVAKREVNRNSQWKRGGKNQRKGGRQGAKPAAVTKEDLDRELDEYRQKANVPAAQADVEMGEI